MNPLHLQARMIDPQQRQLLEVSMEALKYSGFDKLLLRKLDVGVFVGCCTNDWYGSPVTG